VSLPGLVYSRLKLSFVKDLAAAAIIGPRIHVRQVKHAKKCRFVKLQCQTKVALKSECPKHFQNLNLNR
jgi:hypothetical protein